MPPHKKLSKNTQSYQKQLQQDHQIPEQHTNIQELNVIHNSNIQISSAQAQLYFEYLRKKIVQQTNDPFSLPFLNLKFQQIDSSWKGATQQLNLESKIYGMRVDNCHENTVKMLNYVIRNQQEQIGKNITGNQNQIHSQNEKENKQQKLTQNLYLEKPQKLIGNVQLDTVMQNRSLWKFIFKKSQSLNQIQLNILELSNRLALQIDQKKINYQPSNLEKNPAQNQQKNSPKVDVFSLYPKINTQIQIFSQIQIIKKLVYDEVQQIQSNRKKKKLERKQIQNPLNYFGFQNLAFSNFYQNYQQLQKNEEVKTKKSQKSSIFQPENQEELLDRAFNSNLNPLHSIPIQFESEHQSSSSSENKIDLYEPQKDILFNRTLKKKKKANKKFKKAIKNGKAKIDFSTLSFIRNVKSVLHQSKPPESSLKNNNLVPINFVTIYESRNPFKKIKKIPKTSTKANNIYQINYPNYQCFENEQIQENQGKNQQNANIPHHFFTTEQDGLAFNNADEVFEEKQSQNFRPYKIAHMKSIKEEIEKQLKSHEHSMLATRKLGQYSSQEQLEDYQQSMMNSYLEQEAELIGLKFLKSKMINYDPLDILISMLHLAYEQQVKLQPIYLSKPEDGHQTGQVVLHDLVILRGGLQ